jgi:hypothetical protein
MKPEHTPHIEQGDGSRMSALADGQAHLVLTFAAPSYRDPDIYVLQVLSNILGGGMSSRLFQEVREKRGLCYSVFSFGSAYEDAGQVGVYAATSPEHSNELLDLTTGIMLSVAAEVTEAEVARAKAQLKAGEWNIVLGIELARLVGARIGDKVTIVAPGGQVTPAGVPSFKLVLVGDGGTGAPCCWRFLLITLYLHCLTYDGRPIECVVCALSSIWSWP